MNKMIVTLGILIGALAITTSSFAKFTGPGSNGVVTVDSILKHPKDDSHVLLIGHIIKQLPNKNLYTFKDDTGTITAEIKSKYFPTQNFGPMAKVELTAEVEKEWFHPAKIEVKAPIKVISVALN